MPRAASRSRFSAQEHRAAAGREHDARGRGQLVDHVALADAEALFALALEDVGDVDARARLDLGIAVGERQPEPAGELPANRRLAGTHRADEEDTTLRAARGRSPLTS